MIIGKCHLFLGHVELAIDFLRKAVLPTVSSAALAITHPPSRIDRADAEPPPYSAGMVG
jgi:hypothetical protein